MKTTLGLLPAFMLAMAMAPLAAPAPDSTASGAAAADDSGAFQGGQRGGGRGDRGGRGGGGGRAGRGGQPPGDQDRNRENAFTFNANRIYARAIQLKFEDNCSGAVPLFRCLAKRGRGYELAQYHLGRCLLTLRVASTDEAERADHWTKAAAWTRLAADAGLAEAQGALALMLVDRENTEPEPTEAGKWYRLQQRNPLRLALGGKALSAEEAARLYAVLTDQDWRLAEARANTWRRQYMVSKIGRNAGEPDPDCPGRPQARPSPSPAPNSNEGGEDSPDAAGENGGAPVGAEK